MTIRIPESEIIRAASEGMDAFIQVFYDAIMDAIGGELNETTMQELNGEQITLLAYIMLRNEVMDGGFVQLIHNGYGGFIFLNPFAKAMRLWGAHDFSKLVYKGRKLFEQHGEALTKDCSDEEFMALFEQFPEFDELDDEFVECEEEVTELIARYVDEHIEKFAEIGGRTHAEKVCDFVDGLLRNIKKHFLCDFYSFIKNISLRRNTEGFDEKPS